MPKAGPTEGIRGLFSLLFVPEYDEIRLMSSTVIGLTGGIGSGKSSVASLLKKQGAVIIDADAIGREVVESNRAVLDRLVVEFGDRFLRSDGTLDRKALGDFVFSSEERKARLNAIVHPELWKECRRRIDSARKDGAGLIVVDAALIYETGLEKHLDGVVVVSASLDNRIARIKKRDGMTHEAVLNRINSQMAAEEKERRATWLVQNDGSFRDLEAGVADLLRIIQSGTR